MSRSPTPWVSGSCDSLFSFVFFYQFLYSIYLFPYSNYIIFGFVKHLPWTIISVECLIWTIVTCNRLSLTSTFCLASCWPSCRSSSAKSRIRISVIFIYPAVNGSLTTQGNVHSSRQREGKLVPVSSVTRLGYCRVFPNSFQFITN
jgi:hypothetical protein